MHLERAKNEQSTNSKRNKRNQRSEGKMKYKNFNEYLMCICIEETNCLDDDAPDVFDNWLMEREIESLIQHGTIYGLIKEIEGVERTSKIYNAEVPNLEESIK